MELRERDPAFRINIRPWSVLVLVSLAVAVFILPFNLALAVDQENTPLSRGLQEYKNGNFQDARSEFERAIKAQPNNAKAHYYLGLCLSRLGENAEAALALEEARELEPEMQGISLNLGIVYYKLEAFEAALLELNRVLQEDPKSGSAHLFIALSQQGQGRYKESISSLERARELDPDYRQLSLYYTGIAYYKMGEEGSSREALHRTIDVDPESDTAKQAQAFLETIAAEGREKKRWRIEASTGVEYDDNLTVVERDLITDASDWAAVFEFEGGYKFLDYKPFEGEITYNFYLSEYEVFQNPDEDTSQFDSNSHTLGLSTSTDIDKWDLGLEYNYSYIFLGGDSFLKMHSVSPSLGFLPTDNLYLNMSYVFRTKDFFEKQDKPRDSVNNSLGLDAFLFFMDYEGYVQIGYRLEREKTSGDEFDYRGHTVTGAVKIPLPYKSKVRFMYQYLLKDYLHITPFIGKEREDNRHTFNVVLSKEISEHFEVKVDYEHVRNDSNLSTVDYNENTFFIGVVFRL